MSAETVGAGASWPPEDRDPAPLDGEQAGALEAGGSRDRRDLLNTHARPGEPLADLAVSLEPDARHERGIAGRVDLHERRASRGEQLARAPQQHVGRAADPDVAVEQQRRAVAAGAGHGAEDVTVDRGSAAPAREADRDGGEVDAETALAGLAQRREMAARSAPEIH